jgi:hypothetical protein
MAVYVRQTNDKYCENYLAEALAILVQDRPIQIQMSALSLLYIHFLQDMGNLGSPPRFFLEKQKTLFCCPGVKVVGSNPTAPVVEKSKFKK